VALHTNNNTTINSVAPHAVHANNKTMITSMTTRNKEKRKEKEKKRLFMEAFPLAPRSSLIAHGKRNG